MLAVVAGVLILAWVAMDLLRASAAHAAVPRRGGGFGGGGGGGYAPGNFLDNLVGGNPGGNPRGPNMIGAVPIGRPGSIIVTDPRTGRPILADDPPALSDILVSALKSAGIGAAVGVIGAALKSTFNAGIDALKSLGSGGGGATTTTTPNTGTSRDTLQVPQIPVAGGGTITAGPFAPDFPVAPGVPSYFSTAEIAPDFPLAPGLEGAETFTVPVAVDAVGNSGILAGAWNAAANAVNAALDAVNSALTAVGGIAGAIPIVGMIIQTGLAFATAGDKDYVKKREAEAGALPNELKIFADRVKHATSQEELDKLFQWSGTGFGVILDNGRAVVRGNHLDNSAAETMLTDLYNAQRNFLSTIGQDDLVKQGAAIVSADPKLTEANISEFPAAEQGALRAFFASRLGEIHKENVTRADAATVLANASTGAFASWPITNVSQDITRGLNFPNESAAAIQDLLDFQAHATDQAGRPAESLRQLKEIEDAAHRIGLDSVSLDSSWAKVQAEKDALAERQRPEHIEYGMEGNFNTGG